MECSNCGRETEVTSLLLNHSGFGYVAAICHACQEGVTTLKIVLTRATPEGKFEYDGYLPVASARDGAQP